MLGKNFSVGEVYKKLHNPYSRRLWKKNQLINNVGSAGFTLGYIGLSLGSQDRKGPPTNCGTHRVNARDMIIYIKLRQIFMS